MACACPALVHRHQSAPTHPPTHRLPPGFWPYSYSTCGQGSGGQPWSLVPGQIISACPDAAGNSRGKWGMAAGQGRGAPEFDIFEVRRAAGVAGRGGKGAGSAIPVSAAPVCCAGRAARRSSACRPARFGLQSALPGSLASPGSLTSPPPPPPLRPAAPAASSARARRCRSRCRWPRCCRRARPGWAARGCVTRGRRPRAPPRPTRGGGTLAGRGTGTRTASRPCPGWTPPSSLPSTSGGSTGSRARCAGV